MATLGELWAGLFPAAVSTAPPDRPRLDREIAWVRVLKARVPAFEALDPGDVAIVPASALAVVAPSDTETTALAEATAAAGVAALLLVPGEGDDRALAALGDAAALTGVPAFRLDRTDPVQLERSVIGFLVNRRAELEHQAGLLEATLEEMALHHADLPALVAAVAGFLGRAVALEGPDGALVAIHVPPDAAGSAAAAGAYLGPARTAALRLQLPVPSEAEAGERPGPRRPAGGRLVLPGDHPATELERTVAARIARLLALELARAEAIRQAADQARRGEKLPADGPPWVMLLARQVSPGSRPPLEEREAVRARLRQLAPARRLGLRGDADSVEVRIVLAGSPVGAAAPTEPGAGPRVDSEPTVQRIADLLGRPVAVSRPFVDPLGRPAAEAEARTTLEAIEALPDPPRVARGDRLPAYRLMASLQSLPEGSRHARALLEPLLAGTAEARRERLATLRAILEQPGFAEAAAALGVHRNTLAYRIRRIEALTGWHLADPEVRLPLAVAVRLVQSEQ